MEENPKSDSMTIFRVGEWTVSPPTNVIRKGDEIRHLTPKVMDVLVFMVKQPGKVIERDDFFNQVWADINVSDDSLNFAIAGLRRAFDDDPRDPKYIETIPKRGYRLIADVSGPELEGGTAVATIANRGWNWKGLMAVACFILAVISGLYLWTRWQTDSSATVPTGLQEVSILVNRDGFRQPLRSGDSITLGDQLSLEVLTREPLYVYVVNCDENGEAYLLFPLPDTDVQNPISPGQVVSLPGTVRGAPGAWEVSSTGNREHFFILAGRTPLDLGPGQEIRLDSPIFADDLARGDEGSEQFALRGVGRVGELVQEQTSRAGELRAALAQLAEKRGAEFRQFTFENP